jgi:hypothetical protein
MAGDNFSVSRFGRFNGSLKKSKNPLLETGSRAEWTQEQRKILETVLNQTL